MKNMVTPAEIPRLVKVSYLLCQITIYQLIKENLGETPR